MYEFFTFDSSSKHHNIPFLQRLITLRRQPHQWQNVCTVSMAKTTTFLHWRHYNHGSEESKEVYSTAWCCVFILSRATPPPKKKKRGLVFKEAHERKRRRNDDERGSDRKRQKRIEGQRVTIPPLMEQASAMLFPLITLMTNFEAA